MPRFRKMAEEAGRDPASLSVTEKRRVRTLHERR